MLEKFAALKNGKSHEFSANDQPKCPHCGEEFDIAHNEAWRLYDENDTHTVECPSCENQFNVNSHARWTFSTDEQEEN
ncbi:MAG: hypothetical protein DI604_28105 [Delftia acidovorans]|nr:MAG: hypothetical protein DI604_28105 [Delftia acidovorans]